MNKTRLETQVQWTLPEANAPLSLTKTPSVSTTEVASQGGLLINIDNAVGDIEATANGFVESEKYGFWAQYWLWGVRGISFSSAVKRTGRLTLKIYSQIASYATANMNGNWTNITINTRANPVKPNTKYKVTCYVNATVNSWTPSVKLELKTFNSSFWSSGNPTSTVVSATTNWWVMLSDTFTTSATAAWLEIAPIVTAAAAHDTIAYFDVNSMTFDEITEPVTNSLTSKSPSLVGFTAVGSTDNVDQSQTTANQATQFGMSGADSTNPTKLAQQFVCTKPKFTWFIFRRVVSTGTFTWDVTVWIYADSGTNTPTGTALATYTWTNAQWEAIAAETDYTVSLPCILTTDGTTKYHIVFQSTTSDSSNYPRVKVGSGATSYPSWVALAFSGASTWTPIGLDLYFKTLHQLHRTPEQRRGFHLGRLGRILGRGEDWFGEWDFQYA